MINIWLAGMCEPVNPHGHTVYAVVIKKDAVLLQRTIYMGWGAGKSLHVAEMMAAVAALEWLDKNPQYQDDHIVVHSNSGLVVNLLTRKWQAHEGMYMAYFERAVWLLDYLRPEIEWKLIPAEANHEAIGACRRLLMEYGVPIREELL